MNDNTILSVENIHAAYGKKEILKGVSIRINKGEIVCLVGPNGAGKSTLLKTIIGLLLPKQGKIFFDTTDITFLPANYRAKLGIGYLFQGGAVFTNLTVIENLKISVENISTKDFNDKLEKIFMLFPSLKEMENYRAGVLSGGLKQMLSLAMILIREPKILLLDEPSAGLAPIMVKSMIQKIKEINQTEKITVLLVEQNIRQALSISHRAYLLKNGEIIKEEQEPEKLLEEKNFEKIFFET